jgi:hypothetical protein
MRIKGVGFDENVYLCLTIRRKLRKKNILHLLQNNGKIYNVFKTKPVRSHYSVAKKLVELVRFKGFV